MFPTDSTRWLEAFNPVVEDAYAEFDCPRGRVVKEHDAREADELTLRIGDHVNILERDKFGWSRGSLARTLLPTSRATKGWYVFWNKGENFLSLARAECFPRPHLLFYTTQVPKGVRGGAVQ